MQHNKLILKQDLAIVADKIRHLLAETGMSQRQLAAAADVSQAKLSRLLSGVLTRLSREEWNRLETVVKDALISQPTMHKEYKIGDRVEFLLAGQKIQGEIGGISHQNIAFTYLVLLDIPLDVPGYDRPWKVVSIWGTELRPL